MKLIEDEYDNLKGVLPKNFSIFSKDLLRELLRIFNKEVLQKAEGDLFGKIYEYFLNKFAMTGAQEGGEFFTPMSLVQTIVNVIEPDHGIVFDPACGSAGMSTVPFGKSIVVCLAVGKPNEKPRTVVIIVPVIARNL